MANLSVPETRKSSLLDHADDIASLLGRIQEVTGERDAYRELLKISLAQKHDLTRQVRRLTAELATALDRVRELQARRRAA